MNRITRQVYFFEDLEVGMEASFAKTVSASNAFIVVCGEHTDPPWLIRQVKEGRKYGTQNKPSTSLAVYDRRGKDEEMQFSFSGLRLLDCRSRLNEGLIGVRQFAAPAEIRRIRSGIVRRAAAMIGSP
jgi:hypothetical protein